MGNSSKNQVIATNPNLVGTDPDIVELTTWESYRNSAIKSISDLNGQFARNCTEFNLYRKAVKDKSGKVVTESGFYWGTKLQALNALKDLTSFLKTCNFRIDAIEDRIYRKKNNMAISQLSADEIEAMIEAELLGE